MGEEYINSRKIYFAPLEGIGGYLYRNAFHQTFGGVEKYFTPFVSPGQHRTLTPKERKDILPEHNKGMYVVPQILTNQPEYFMRTARELQQTYGYEEINLNLGCPSGTVVSKGKGAGFLGRKEELAFFLDQVIDQAEKAGLKISVKTRIGIESPEEFYDLLPIFNRFPLHELIIHPRVQKDYYKNPPHKKVFVEAVQQISSPLCYNGDIFHPRDYRVFSQEFPQISRLMLGRGLLINPGLARGIMNEEGEGISLPEKQEIRTFHDKLYHGYREYMQGDTPVLFKMKELWFYLGHLFNRSEKYVKKIKKATRLSDYEAIVELIFDKLEIDKEYNLSCIIN
ncbi:MAG: tRNA-dihydrouridine synthase family protein [Lachnospiraceae bacterium]|nr:tRNA-dihydrouridine synthase family protein [Lachnospiraceae bacterium]